MSQKFLMIFHWSAGRKFQFVVFLAFALCLALSGCGKDTEAGSETQGALSGSVKVVAASGAGETMFSALPGDYSFTVSTSLSAVEDAVIRGDFDFAVVSATKAAELYQSTGGNIAAVSPVTLNGWNLVSKDVYLPEGEISYLRGKTIIACDQGGTGGYTLAMVLDNGGINPDYSIHMEWVDTPGEVVEALAEPGTVALVQQPFLAEALAVEGSILSIQLDNFWESQYNVPVPTDVLIVSKTFLSERADDFPIAISDMREAFRASRQEASGMVFYGSSDRGMRILREYLSLVSAFDPEALGGGLPADDFYVGRGE